MTAITASAWAATIPNAVILAHLRSVAKPCHGIPGVTVPPHLDVGAAHAALADRAYQIGGESTTNRCLQIATTRAGCGCAVMAVVPKFAVVVPGIPLYMAHRFRLGKYADRSGHLVVPRSRESALRALLAEQAEAVPPTPGTTR